MIGVNTPVFCGGLANVMRIPNKAASEYYFLLKSIFPKITYEEARFLKEFKADIIEFSLTHPHCTYDTLVEEFGSPQDVFHEYFDVQDIELLTNKIKRQHFIKIIFRFVVCSMIICLISYCILLVHLKNKIYKEIPSHITISVIPEDIQDE